MSNPLIIRTEQLIAAIQMIAGMDLDTPTQGLPVGVDVPTQSLRVNNWVYNPSSGNWERMKQPTVEIGDLTVSMSDVEALLAEAYWKQTRFDYSGDDVIYSGKHTSMTAAETDDAWRVYKWTWVGGNLTRKQGPAVGAWSNRVNLFS